MQRIYTDSTYQNSITNHHDLISKEVDLKFNCNETNLDYDNTEEFE